VELWIHDFKKIGERTLSEAERDAFRGLSRRYSALGFLLFGVSSTMILGGLIALLGYADHRWGFLLWVLWTAAWCFAFKRISSLHNLSCLFSRAQRKPEVWIWERSPRPSFSRFQCVINVELKAGDDEDEYLNQASSFEKEYGVKEWLSAEQFERRLERIAGEPCDRFETCGADQVILSAQNRAADRLLTVFPLRCFEEEIRTEEEQSRDSR
jgi:hypothetical protein